jgi:hypothetical protein
VTELLEQGGQALMLTTLLRAGGCPITPAWALTVGNLLFQAGRCR